MGSFESALTDLITEWHDERGTGFDEIISALELQLGCCADQHADETEGE